MFIVLRGTTFICNYETVFYKIVSGGRRGKVTLGHIMQFVTGVNEEPILGYTMQPSIAFTVVGIGGFLPNSSTCINCLKLPRGTADTPLPDVDKLHCLYDYAFSNVYFGLL